MKTASRITAFFIAAITIALWFFGGPNLGRTKITEVVHAVDSATGKESVSHETRFLPGIDFLSIGLLCATIFWVGTRFFRSTQSAN